MDTNEITREGVIAAIIGVLLPDAPPSRARVMTRVLNSLTGAQLATINEAVVAAFRTKQMSVLRDAVESRDLLTIEAAARWGKMMNLRALEGALNQQFSISDLSYDIYLPVFEAHIEAYATYHSHCGNCTPYDRDIEYSALEGTGVVAPTEVRHYLDYLQDYELMELVEENPEMVSTLVKFAAERGGIDEELLAEIKASDGNALLEGIL